MFCGNQVPTKVTIKKDWNFLAGGRYGLGRGPNNQPFVKVYNDKNHTI